MEDFYQAPVEEQIDRLRALALEALKHWAVEGCEPVLLKYRENAVFKVRTPGGQPAALRVHRHGYHSDAELRSELAWMAALRADGVETPAAAKLGCQPWHSRFDRMLSGANVTDPRKLFTSYTVTQSRLVTPE